MKRILIALVASTILAPTAFAANMSAAVKGHQRHLVCWSKGSVPTSLGWERQDGARCVFDIARNKAIWAKEVQ